MPSHVAPASSFLPPATRASHASSRPEKSSPEPFERYLGKAAPEPKAHAKPASTRSATAAEPAKADTAPDSTLKHGAGMPQQRGAGGELTGAPANLTPGEDADAAKVAKPEDAAVEAPHQSVVDAAGLPLSFPGIALPVKQDVASETINASAASDLPVAASATIEVVPATNAPAVVASGPAAVAVASSIAVDGVAAVTRAEGSVAAAAVAAAAVAEAGTSDARKEASPAKEEPTRVTPAPPEVKSSELAAKPTASHPVAVKSEPAQRPAADRDAQSADETTAEHAAPAAKADAPAQSGAQPAAPPASDLAAGAPAPAPPVNAFNVGAALNGISVASAKPAAAAGAPADGKAGTDSVPISGVAIEIAARAAEGKRRFEIRLDPPELGRIDVRLDFGRDGQVTSRLVVERAETLDLLRRDSAGLERALADAGVRTPDSGLQFSLRDQSQQQRQSGHEPSGRPTLLIVPDENVMVREAVRRGYGALRGLGSGIDIQV